MSNTLAYGFSNLLDIFPAAVTENLEAVNTAMQQFKDEHNRQMQNLFGLFCEYTTNNKGRYNTLADAEMQESDEYTEGLPIKGGDRYDVAWPILSGILSQGLTEEAAKKMTVEEANRKALQVQLADIKFLRKNILRALFANVAWPWSSEEDGSLTIQGLANGDAVKYLLHTGATSTATDTHYLATNSAMANSDFEGIREELLEHPENSGDVVALVPTNLKATVEALTGFYPVADANISFGSGVSTLKGAPSVQVPGELFGYHEGKVWLYEWRSLPDSYIVAVCTGGNKALRARQEKLASLQGLRLVAENEGTHPFYKTTWKRHIGFGGYNRVNALVKRFGNASYAVPTGYETPSAS